MSVQIPKHDRTYMPKPVCPHCGHVKQDPYELRMHGDEDSADVDCGQCEKTYVVIQHVDIDYTTLTEEEAAVLDGTAPCEAAKAINAPTPPPRAADEREGEKAT